MTKKNYKEVATRYYHSDITAYNQLYASIRCLVDAHLLDTSWLNFVWELDKKLYYGESNND